MTAIAFRDGILAAERACNNEGARVGYREKVRRIKGARIAMTGELSVCLAILCWIELGRGPDMPADEGGTIIFIPDEGEATLIENGHESPLPAAPYHAWGAGRDFALGAMHHGASAGEAVAAAIAHCNSCGGDVDELGPA